jgi:putative hydrolase of HD superfamily
MEERADKLLNFLKEIEKYKLVERRTFCSNLRRRESDAEHSWHLAMIVLLFEKELAAKADILKMLKIYLIHDLAEIYAGDPFAFDKAEREGKEEREEDALKKLPALLPKDVEDKFKNLLGEYRESKTIEAKIVQSLDKLQPILQNICSGGKSWKDNKINFGIVDSYKRPLMEHDRFILGLYLRLTDEARSKKYLQ